MADEVNLEPTATLGDFMNDLVVFASEYVSDHGIASVEGVNFTIRLGTPTELDDKFEPSSEVFVSWSRTPQGLGIMFQGINPDGSR